MLLEVEFECCRVKSRKLDIQKSKFSVNTMLGSIDILTMKSTDSLYQLKVQYYVMQWTTLKYLWILLNL